ncbi:MAG: TetR/AcrR family transcriptional regulator [Nocardioidaceae bacterium]
MSSTSGTPVPAVRRSRLTADDRRRQLLGIGLSKLVVKPISDLSIDEVAAEAGISRGLLFHYFPTKRDFYLACVAAAGRRILRRTAPDPDAAPDEQVRDMVRLFTQQIERRREFYLSLVRGTGGGDVGVAEVVDTIREGLTGRVLSSLSLDDPPLDGPSAGPSAGAWARPVVHAWWAYVEDRAIAWSAEPPDRRTESLDELVNHDVAALKALLDLSG